MLDILVAAGCRATATAGGVRLEGPATRPLEADLRDAPDLFPVLAVALARLGGRLSGLSGLVHKESDRLGEMVRLLGELGASLRREGDEMRAGGAGSARRRPLTTSIRPATTASPWPWRWQAWWRPGSGWPSHSAWASPGPASGRHGRGWRDRDDAEASWLSREHLSLLAWETSFLPDPSAGETAVGPDSGRPGGAPLAPQPAPGRRGAGPGCRQLPAGARLLPRAAGAARRQAPQTGAYRVPATDLSPAVAARWPAPRAAAPASPGMGRGPAGADRPAAPRAVASRAEARPWRRWSGAGRPGRWAGGGSECWWRGSGRRRSRTPKARAGRSGRVVWRRSFPVSGGPRRKARRAGWRLRYDGRRSDRGSRGRRAGRGGRGAAPGPGRRDRAGRRRPHDSSPAHRDRLGARRGCRRPVGAGAALGAGAGPCRGRPAQCRATALGGAPSPGGWCRRGVLDPTRTAR